MAIDQALFDRANAGHPLHLWRLYRWAPHCLSFGRHEPAARRYDRARIEALGIDCVRRPTGGRAVWHGRELTYSVVAPIARYGSLREAYLTIHQTLAAAIGALGPTPALAAARATPGLAAGPCFGSAVGGEVTIDARKVLGSAQRRGSVALLQHGSLLLEDDQEVARSVTIGARSGPPPETTLAAILARPIQFAEAAAAISARLAEEGVEPVDPTWPNEVLRDAERHYDTYRSATWTWER